MKSEIDGVEITPEMIVIMRDWAPASSLDVSRPEMHVRSLSKVQDFVTRQLENYGNDPEMMIEISNYLSSIIIIKDSLSEMAEIWKGGPQ